MPAVMEVVDRFPYLGDMVARDGSDTHAVNGRIEAGSKAFGALRGCIFSSTSINRQAKLAVYEAIVLSITLYGSECWSLTETLRQRLRVMQATISGTMSTNRSTRISVVYNAYTRDQRSPTAGIILASVRNSSGTAATPPSHVCPKTHTNTV